MWEFLNYIYWNIIRYFSPGAQTGRGGWCHPCGTAPEEATHSGPSAESDPRHYQPDLLSTWRGALPLCQAPSPSQRATVKGHPWHRRQRGCKKT
jgi:hypothetical protein